MKPAPKQLNITIYLKKLLKGCIQNLTGTVDTLDALSKDVLLKRGSSRDPWTKKTWDTSVQRVNYKHLFFLSRWAKNHRTDSIDNNEEVIIVQIWNAFTKLSCRKKISIRMMLRIWANW